jgi:excisionase family DNA binding protein
MKTYSTFAIARMLQVDPGSVANWIDQGLLKAHRTPGRHRRVVESDLQAFLVRQQMPMPPQFDAPPPPPPPTRVLVIDSDRKVVDAIRQAVQAEHPGYEVLEAGDGFRAGSLLADCKPSVLVMDLTMPGFDGFDICRLIKSQPQTSHIHVLATSPRAGYVKHKKDILSCGAIACLRKPLDMADLMEQMQPLL